MSLSDKKQLKLIHWPPKWFLLTRHPSEERYFQWYAYLIHPFAKAQPLQWAEDFTCIWPVASFPLCWKTQLKFTETVNRRAGTQLSTGQAAFDIVRSNSATCAEATQPRKQGTKHVLLLQTSGIMQCMQESKSQIDLWVLFLLRKGKRGRERERETERETLLCFLFAACCLCILKMRLWTTILRILKQNDQNPIYTLNEWRA